MRFVTWTVRLLIFFFLLAFAVKNTELVALRFYFELVWKAPLIVLLLLFFVTGTVFGLVAALTMLFNQRREILRLKRELSGPGDSAAAAAAPVQPPGADA